MPQKFVRAEADKAALAKAHPKRYRRVSSAVMRVVKSRWPAGSPGRKQAMGALKSMADEGGLSLEDLELLAMSTLLQLEEEYKEKQISGSVYFKNAPKIIEGLRKISESKRMMMAESAPGTLRVVFEQAPELVAGLADRLEAEGESSAAGSVRKWFDQGEIVEAEFDEGPGDELEVV